jgi:hypothetical protein
MGSYRLLFGVAVEHDFFSNGLCQALNFVPTPGTDAAIEKAGLLIRQTVNGIRIFYDDGKTERLQICAADPDVPLTLSFKVDSEDPFFYNYTEPIIYRRDAVLFFDNHATEGEPSGKLRLHSEAFAAQADLVSETDLTDLTVEAGSEPNDEAGIASVIRDVLKDRERVLWPAFIVSIQIPPKDGTLFDAQSDRRSGNTTWWEIWLEKTPILSTWIKESNLKLGAGNLWQITALHSLLDQRQPFRCGKGSITAFS